MVVLYVAVVKDVGLNDVVVGLGASEVVAKDCGRVVVLGSCMAVLAFVLCVYISVVVVGVGVVLTFCFFLNWFVSITLHTFIRGTYAVVAVVVRCGAGVLVVVVGRGARVGGGRLMCCDGWLNTGSWSSSMLSYL